METNKGDKKPKKPISKKTQEPKTPKKSNRGRKSKYRPEYADEAFKLCLLGARDVDLARIFLVNIDTIHEWKKVHPNFSDSLTRGREKADCTVASKLYERALGFEWEEEVAVKYRTGKGMEESVKVVKVKRVIPPDTVAAIFWLKNRQKKNWRDKVDMNDSNLKKLAPIKMTFKMDRDLNAEEGEKPKGG